jgi:hypothetical protein
MKHLAITAAALFLFAAAGAFAQTNSDTDNANNNGGSNAGGNGNAQENEVTGTVSGSNRDGADCPLPGPGQTFDTFSERCRAEINIWIEKQAAASTAFDGDVAVGTVLPETVEVIEVPAYRDYGYVVLNDRRVLVDRNTRTVVRVF